MVVLGSARLDASDRFCGGQSRTRAVVLGQSSGGLGGKSGSSGGGSLQVP